MFKSMKLCTLLAFALATVAAGEVSVQLIQAGAWLQLVP